MNNNSLMKKLICYSRKSDPKSTRVRSRGIILVLILTWSLFALVIIPNLFSLQSTVLSSPRGVGGIFIEILSWFFRPPTLFLVINVFLGAFVAYELASYYLNSIYGKSNLIHSGLSLWKKVFGVAKGELIKIEPGSEWEKKTVYLAEIGGPAKIIVSAENAVILEKDNHRVQIVGPTINLPQNFYYMENFEILKEVVNLQNQSIHLDVKIRTKDGYPLTIKNLHAIYSVSRNEKTSTLTRPFPFNAQGIFSLYYQTPPGSIQLKFTNILKRELIIFSRHFNSFELLPQIKSPAQENIPHFVPQSLKNFIKRKEYNYWLKKANRTFNEKHLHRKQQLFRKSTAKIHLLYQDLNNFSKMIENKASKFPFNAQKEFFTAFQAYINPILENKGLQLILLSQGSVTFDKNNDQLSDSTNDIFYNPSKNSPTFQTPEKSSKPYTTDEMASFKDEIDKSGSSLPDKTNQNIMLNKMKSILAYNLGTSNIASESYKYKLEIALENIDQLIKNNL